MNKPALQARHAKKEHLIYKIPESSKSDLSILQFQATIRDNSNTASFSL